MLVDTTIDSRLAKAPEVAAAAEAAGYDAIWTAEVGNDPFLPLALAATSTEKITLGTSIAVAFARSPMTMAQMAWDLNELSGGRFVLGLGSQIKPHITKRYSMPWSKPAARMKELIEAMQAIWHTWETGDKLDFRGEFYTHTIMTPMFTPRHRDHGAPKVFLAGVGPLMTQVAGEVADGFLAHGFTTAEFMRDVTLPKLAEGRAKSGRTDEIEVALPGFVVTGSTEEEMAANAKATKERIAFYGSTPAYKPVLDHHGWGDLQPELNAMSKRGEWQEMGTLIDDDVLNAFAVVAEPEHLGKKMAERYTGLVDRVSFYTPSSVDADLVSGAIAELHAAS